MMSMELLVAGNSNICRDVWFVAVWLVFRPGRLYR